MENDYTLKFNSKEESYDKIEKEVIELFNKKHLKAPQRAVDAILSFSRSYDVINSESIGCTEITLN